ncbi:MAG: TetR/AcrR family transcriptional regulator [Lachnospiraceae bacterium]|nr:TetR/AcrR family transcriptional regulator [Lachnospiraceae bacterium]
MSISEAKLAERKEHLQKTAYELYSTRTIEEVSNQDVADASGYGIATVYRYFTNKNNMVVAASVWGWKQFATENRNKRARINLLKKRAIDRLNFFLDSFLDLYTDHKDLLRFNQMFNLYIQSSGMSVEELDPYERMIAKLEAEFHDLYEAAKKDGTVRTDISEAVMFSTILHLMLASVTRYAVGLVYKPKKGFNDIKELKRLKEMMLKEFSSNDPPKG